MCRLAMTSACLGSDALRRAVQREILRGAEDIAALTADARMLEIAPRIIQASFQDLGGGSLEVAADVRYFAVSAQQAAASQAQNLGESMEVCSNSAPQQLNILHLLFSGKLQPTLCVRLS